MASKTPTPGKCGAKLRGKNTGKFCSNSPMPNGRCRMHGGATPTGNTAMIKHGLFRKGYTEEELESLEEIRAQRNSVDDLIDYFYIQVQRCAEALRKIENGDDDFGFELAEQKQKASGTTEYDDEGKVVRSPKQEVERTRKRPDFRTLQDRYAGRLQSLIVTRKQLELLEVEEVKKEMDSIMKKLVTALEDVHRADLGGT